MLYKSLSVEALQWSLEMDLTSDFDSLLEKRMKVMNIMPTGKKDVAYEYFNLIKRWIPQRPRRVIKSKEFVCPHEYERALTKFIDAAIAGENLNVYLSDNIIKADQTDDLLNDWNIMHFHLTRRFRDDGFAKRSDYQIFARVEENCIYLIQIYAHKADYLYCKQEMNKIIENNWPELLEPYKLKGVVGLSEEIDDKMYEELRKNHISSFVQTGENKVYGMMGGGYMSDGSSGEARIRADFWHNRLKWIEISLRENFSEILKRIREMNDDTISDCEIRMLQLPMDADEMMFVELKNQIGIEFLQKQGKFQLYRMGGIVTK